MVIETNTKPFDRALLRSMGEILFSCGSNKRAVIATLSVIGDDIERSEGSKDEVSGRLICDAPVSIYLYENLLFNWILTYMFHRDSFVNITDQYKLHSTGNSKIT